MTRGVLATIYCRGRTTTEACLDAARRFYAGRAFVRVTDVPPQTKWTTSSNLGVRQLCGRSGPQPGDRDGHGGQPRKGSGRSGDAECEPDVWPA